MKNGVIISFEGPDGAGKTSVLERIIPLLQAQGLSVLATREPGGVAIAERIREVILDVHHVNMDYKTELLLYMAARRQHYVEKVLPALENGKIVLIDRFIDSSIAYQGAGRGLDEATITQLNDFATDGCKPDITIYLDIKSELGLQRIAQNAEREVNRLDLEKLDMHQRVRQGYLRLAEQEKDRIVTIDASRDLDSVVEEVYQVILQHLA